LRGQEFQMESGILISTFEIIHYTVTLYDIPVPADIKGELGLLVSVNVLAVHFQK
jgi:hypothetical protein